MLGPPVDAWYLWIGLAAASLALVGVALSLPPEPPSTAESAAETIEEVGAARPPASGEHPIDAQRVRVGPHRLTIEGESTDTATLDHGRMVPAPRGTPLRRVAVGASPADAFSDADAFAAAVEERRDRERILEPVGDRLTARHVRYGGTDAILVTA